MKSSHPIHHIGLVRQTPDSLGPQRLHSLIPVKEPLRCISQIPEKRPNLGCDAADSRRKLGQWFLAVPDRRALQECARLAVTNVGTAKRG
jgi:hypothetical protein